MASTTETYYNILGIPETASRDEIKKAYRSLSLKLHPDKNPDPEAISKFHKISEAYEILGDENKKAEYDNRNNNPFFRMNGMNGMNHGHGGNPFENIDELFSNLFGSGMGGIHVHPGMMHPGMMNPGMMNGMFPPGANIRIFQNGVPINIMQKPPAINKTITINMEQVLNGANIPVEIERWIMENGNRVSEIETLYIPIPKGIDNDELITLKDKGNIINEQIKGDVKIFIKVDNPSEFKRVGLDLIYEKSISLKESLCGFSFELKYINGKSYTINNISGNIIVPNYNKVIANMGLTRESHTGNLIIHFDVKFPETLGQEQIDALKTIL